MLGPNKWRLLTIVAGILLAHAIDSPNRSPRLDQSNSQLPTSFTSPTSINLGLAQDRNTADWQGRNIAVNLYQPFKRFSNADDVRYVERRQASVSNAREWRAAFGAFRYAPFSGTLNSRRRSDSDVPTVAVYEYLNTTAYPVSSESVITTIRPTPGQPIQRYKYSYIPLSSVNLIDSRAPSDNSVDYSGVDRTTPSGQEIQSRTDLNVYQSEHSVLQPQSVQPLAQSQLQPQALGLQQPQLAYHQSISSKIAFPAADATAIPVTSTTTVTSETASEDIQGRRSGMTFAAQASKFGTPFIPQAYQEDDPSHPNFQLPYSEELSSSEPEIRTARGAVYENYPSRTPVQFPGPSSSGSAKPYRDDVTKFGDINGPVTSVQRQFNDYYESQGIRTYDNIYYSDDYRRPRQYYPSPPKSPYFEYSEYPTQPLRSRLIVPYKSSRSPRVIFPGNDNYQNGVYNAENYNNNENVVFR